MGLNIKGTTKANGRKHTLDKFYTKPSVALECIKDVSIETFDVVIEPSAGSGSFSSQIPNCVALDLDPENQNIIKQDFFKFLPEQPDLNILVIGNPPFGVQNNLAINFFNHAAKFANTIAFILPRSFKKQSIQERLNLNFTLLLEKDLPKNSFTLEDKELDVPCVFQIWVKTNIPRKKEEIKTVSDFIFVKKEDMPDLYVQRVGGRAGTAGSDWQERSEQSNYFVKIIDSKISKETFIETVNSIKWKDRDHTVGPRSLSKKELIKGLIEADLIT
jgi:predicted RNA methylase